jgi:methyl-accepting chemotaxis protein
VNQAIQQLEKVTQLNASASEQMSATSEELAAQAAQLQASISFFHVDNDTGPSAPHMRHGAPSAKPDAAKAAKQIHGPAPVRAPTQSVTKGLAAFARNGHADGKAATSFSLDLGHNGADDTSDADFQRY